MKKNNKTLAERLRELEKEAESMPEKEKNDRTLSEITYNLGLIKQKKQYLSQICFLIDSIKQEMNNISISDYLKYKSD